MKENGNDHKTGNYYLGLDVGSSSVGWAATDANYELLKFQGKAMWGARLFEEALDASGRRSARTARRRLERRKQRLLILSMLFSCDIMKVDPLFFQRLQESDLWVDDKKTGSRFSLFNDPAFSDKEYYKKYPTVFHLRKELQDSAAPHDIRLVYLALHHIMKSRGHFLYDTGDGNDEISVGSALQDLKDLLFNDFEVDFSPADTSAYLAALSRPDLGITAKKKLLRQIYGKATDTESINLLAISDMLSGAKVKFADLFQDESLKGAEPDSFSLKDDPEEQYDDLCAVLGERMSLLICLKTLFDAAKLAQILGGHGTISEAKVALYEKNRSDLRSLKQYIRTHAPDSYRKVFSEKKKDLNNYAAYSRYTVGKGEYTCSQEDFCKFLRGLKLPKPQEGDATMSRIFQEIDDNCFLTKLKGSDNGVIPYQLQRRELISILDNASTYLPFLTAKDSDGLTVKEKILRTFEFRIPYYVGPLKNGWAVRFADKEGEKITPWNFDQVIDMEASSLKFIENLIGLCSYTAEKVLPKDSLLYSEFCLRNEINSLRIDGRSLPVEQREIMIRELFYESRKRITKKALRSYLRSKGWIDSNAEISGIDDTVKSSLKSYHDIKPILDKTGDVTMAEDIIRAIVVFGEDKRMLRRWLQRNTAGLDETDFRYLSRLKYADWGRLSETFLTEICCMVNNEKRSVMDMLRCTDCNLMQILSSDYCFAAEAQKHRDTVLGNNRNLTQQLDSLYIAPAVRRSIRQTLRIVDEIVDIRKSVPEKIFVEMARDSSKELKGKRTESRKTQLLALYESCKEESSPLFERLQKEDDNSLRSDKLYLYYTQLGKCMYSGEPIDFASLTRGELYDIDHIFPQSRIKDNSLDNRVLVKNTLNREKSNIYPLSDEIRQRMAGYWALLKERKLISDKKFDRLVRAYPLTDKELSDFVARQLTETQQSTKALTAILQERYGKQTRVVFSKAGNVSDFRHDFGMIKCREVNDLHHAKDAYLNIVVGNVYCTRFTDRFFANIRNENYSLNKVFDFDTPGAWIKERTIITVKKVMAKNNAVVTRMPHEVKGQLYDLQIMPAGKGQLPKKAGLDVERYGGYNKLTGAYYFVAEYTEKKKRIRTIEPVLLIYKDIYEADPLRYCTEILHLTDPAIIFRRILVDALLELNGCRLIGPSGRTGNTYIYTHTYQLALSSEDELYIKEIAKYNERCIARKMELPITEHDNISAEKNLALLDTFKAKCAANVYCSCFGEFDKLAQEIAKGKDAFSQMSIWNQVKLLLEILKSFQCNKSYSNMKELGGAGTRGRVSANKNLSALSSAYLIHQSVTGLYEYRVNLLGEEL